MAEARATIRRGSKPRAAVAPRRGRNLPAKRPGLLRRLLARVPIGQHTVQRIVTWTSFGIGAAVVVAVLQAFGVPAMAGTALAEATGKAGFEVKRVDLTGIKHMDRLTVYAIAFDQHSMAMPLVDLDAVREKLLHYGWVQDARVSRRLPDTLVVDIVERTPAAVWQYQGALKLIDKDGVVLEDVSADAMPDLPLLIGPAANTHADELANLIAHVPALKPVMAGATWIGNRRWDLRFQSGETLALPEGQDEAVRALTRFARLDASQRLLGRGFVHFDMRDPTRFVARLGHNMGAIDGSSASDTGQQQAAPAAAAAATAAPGASNGLEKVNETL